MSQYHEYLHQKSRITDYIDQISGGLFHINRILTTYFPESDIATVIRIQNMIENELKGVIDSIKNV